MNSSIYENPRDMDHLIHILSSFTNYEKSADFHKGRVRYDLKNMAHLCRAAGDPHLKTPCIHITGSKGKGSTALMLTAILGSLGFKTGTFTSPHLERINERIALDGVSLSDEEFVAAAKPVLELLREDHCLRPTFFEFITVMAMQVFAARGVTAAIYEVGLGGRLDSTNVVQPEVAVITTIEKEHCAVLGATEIEIAREKTGIIKKDIPLITTVGPDHSVWRIIEEQAAFLDAPLIAPGRGIDATWKGRDLYLRIEGEIHGPITPPPPAQLQQWNLAAALAAAKRFVENSQVDWKEDVVLSSLSGMTLPGRFEVCSQNPRVILDGAHTLYSIKASVKEASTLCSEGLVVIMALAKDKNSRGVVDAILPSCREIFFTSYPGGRAQDPDTLRTMAGGKGRVAPSPVKALSLAREAAGKEGTILVTGSFYLAGEMRKLFCL